MPYVVVPKEVSTTSASIWIGVDNESDDLDGGPVLLRSALGDQHVEGDWTRLGGQGGGHFLRCKTVVLNGLAARQRIDLQLIMPGGRSVATASVTTLPDRLPSLDQLPFRVLLGSCFCIRTDEEGRAGNRFFRLPAAARPEVKILCGDQVYLDAPASHYLAHTHSPAELEARFLDTYVRTWMQSGTAQGFQQILSEGANYFVSDDHEYWNNAPSRAVLVRDSWGAEGRTTWMRLARDLYEHIQTTARVTIFGVGTLSFCLADTRIDRSDDQSDFIGVDDMRRVQRWVEQLEGPGVLVVGQPVFAERAGVLGNFVDFALPDYGQYGGLVEILNEAAHDLLLLTGDVHFGRVAHCRLSPRARLVEIISSPLALVDKAVGGKWDAAPQRFPAAAIPGIDARDVGSEGYREVDNHFLTLEFSADGRKVNLVVKLWSIAEHGEQPPGVVVYRDLLEWEVA